MPWSRTPRTCASILTNRQGQCQRFPDVLWAVFSGPAQLLASRLSRIFDKGTGPFMIRRVEPPKKSLAEFIDLRALVQMICPSLPV